MSAAPALVVGQGGYEISTDPARLDVEAIHAYLTRSYWSPGISRALVERAAAHSLCFGLYDAAEQVGYARVVTDCTTFAYLCDVYVLEAHRGQGLSKWLMQTVQAHPDLQHLRRFMLATRDAHGLYAAFQFTPIAHPERLMEIVVPDAHLHAAAAGRG
ncbi:GNAT family N-acetyltransferase [Ideonella sp.]|uniref:GNAT family N-acetyltransferase n=1 Tax=Ideonella sp. TaxID=1929293 RepID=UPI0035B22613